MRFLSLIHLVVVELLGSQLAEHNLSKLICYWGKLCTKSLYRMPANNYRVRTTWPEFLPGGGAQLQQYVVEMRCSGHGR
jgi:hypothetical protein